MSTLKFQEKFVEADANMCKVSKNKVFYDHLRMSAMFEPRESTRDSFSKSEKHVKRC